MEPAVMPSATLRHAKLQSGHHHQNTTLCFYDLPIANQRCQIIEYNTEMKTYLSAFKVPCNIKRKVFQHPGTFVYGQKIPLECLVL